MITRAQTKMTTKRKPKSKSKVNEAGNYTKPGMRKTLFNSCLLYTSDAADE